MTDPSERPPKPETMEQAFDQLRAAVRQLWVDIQMAWSAARVIHEAEQVVRDARPTDDGPSGL